MAADRKLIGEPKISTIFTMVTITLQKVDVLVQLLQVAARSEQQASALMQFHKISRWSGKQPRSLMRTILRSLESMEGQSISSITRSSRSKPRLFRISSLSCTPYYKVSDKPLIGMLSMRLSTSLTMEESPSLMFHLQGASLSTTRTPWNKKRNLRASIRLPRRSATSIAYTPRATQLSQLMAKVSTTS